MYYGFFVKRRSNMLNLTLMYFKENEQWTFLFFCLLLILFNIFRQKVSKLTRKKTISFTVKLFQNWPRNQIFCFRPIILKLTKKSSPLFKPGLPPFSQPNLWILIQEKFKLNVYKTSKELQMLSRSLFCLCRCLCLCLCLSKVSQKSPKSLPKVSLKSL